MESIDRDVTVVNQKKDILTKINEEYAKKHKV